MCTVCRPHVSGGEKHEQSFHCLNLLRPFVPTYTETQHFTFLVLSLASKIFPQRMLIGTYALLLVVTRLTHLTLQGNDQNNMLPIWREILRHPRCNLQYLRNIPPSLKTPSVCTELPRACTATLYKLGGDPFFWLETVLLRAHAPEQKMGWRLIFPCIDHWTTWTTIPRSPKKGSETGYRPPSERICLWLMLLLRHASECQILSRFLCPGKDALRASGFPLLGCPLGWEISPRDVLHVIALVRIFIPHHRVPLILTWPRLSSNRNTA